MKDKNGEHKFGDAGQGILFLVFMLVWITDSFILKKTTFLAEYIPSNIRLMIFVIIFIAALLLLKSSSIIVKEKWNPNYVVKTGAYKTVRHPVYLAAILFYLCMTVLTFSAASAVFTVIIFIFYNYIAAYEEKFRLNKHGKAYSDYMTQTGRWLPRLRSAK